MEDLCGLIILVGTIAIVNLYTGKELKKKYEREELKVINKRSG